jgi:hypothetical protein
MSNTLAPPLVESQATFGMCGRSSQRDHRRVPSCRKIALTKLLREMVEWEMREFWRKPARPVTFFAGHSPVDFSSDQNSRIL